MVRLRSWMRRCALLRVIAGMVWFFLCFFCVFFRPFALLLLSWCFLSLALIVFPFGILAILVHSVNIPFNFVLYLKSHNVALHLTRLLLFSQLARYHITTLQL